MGSRKNLLITFMVRILILAVTVLPVFGRVRYDTIPAAAHFSQRSVLRYFRPESQINTTAVFPSKSVVSNSKAAAILAPDEKPAKIPSSLASRRRLLRGIEI